MLNLTQLGAAQLAKKRLHLIQRKLCLAQLAILWLNMVGTSDEPAGL